MVVDGGSYYVRYLTSLEILIQNHYRIAVPSHPRGSTRIATNKLIE